MSTRDPFLASFFSDASAVELLDDTGKFSCTVATPGLPIHQQSFHGNALDLYEADTLGFQLNLANAAAKSVGGSLGFSDAIDGGANPAFL